MVTITLSLQAFDAQCWLVDLGGLAEWLDRRILKVNCKLCDYRDKRQTCYDVVTTTCQLQTHYNAVTTICPLQSRYNVVWSLRPAHYKLATMWPLQSCHNPVTTNLLQPGHYNLTTTCSLQHGCYVDYKFLAQRERLSTLGIHWLTWTGWMPLKLDSIHLQVLIISCWEFTLTVYHSLKSAW